MRYLILLFWVFTFPLFAKKQAQAPFIQVVPSGGRLGDQLLLYVKAKWISYNNNIPLALAPNEHYEGLVMRRKESFFSSFPKSRHRRKIHSPNILLEKKSKGYYFVEYFPLPSYENLSLMRKDPVFMSKVRELISPITPVKLLHLPTDRITVALHIRTESCAAKSCRSVQVYDISTIDTEPFIPENKEYMDFDFPEKFPPLQFYIDQLKILSEYFDHSPLYVYIFTDDLDPENLKNLINKEVNLRNISYNYRKNQVHPELVIHQDFFSMMKFDCLIRPTSSNYSLLADFLGEHKVVIAPKSFHWEKDQKNQCYLVIDSVRLKKG